MRIKILIVKNPIRILKFFLSSSSRNSMKHIFLFLFFLCHSLYAHYSAITEAEPSSLIEGIASVITGDLYLSEEDILIEGAEPLRLKRNYVGVAKHHVLFPHMFAEFFVQKNR